MTLAQHVTGIPPINPVPLGGYTTAGLLNNVELAHFSNFYHLPEYLQALQTVIIYIDPDGNITHLNGPHAGKEGVRLGQTIQGEHHLPFEQVVTESAYQLGATLEKTNITKRLIDCRVVIGREGMNNLLYRMCEDRWWAGQVIDRPGWLGVFTRYSGWRWIQIWPAQTVSTAQKMDPVAYDNNMCIWDLQWIAPRPYYSKPAFYKTWDAKTSGPPKMLPTLEIETPWGQPVEIGEEPWYFGRVPIANQGDMSTYVVYLIEGEGKCAVSDNNSERMVELPEIYRSDGLVMVNTDPVERTLTAAFDPQDNLFYKIARAAGLFKFLLAGLGDRGEALWERKYCRFMYKLPPKTVGNFTVRHTNPNAKITIVVGQRYQRSR